MRNKLVKTYILTAIAIVFKVILNFIFVKAILNIFGSEFNGFRASVLSIMSLLNILEAGMGAVSLYNLYKPLKNKEYKKANGVLSFTNKFFRKIAIIIFIIIIIVAYIYPLVVKDFSDRKIGAFIVIIYGIILVSEYFFDGKYKILIKAEQKIYIIKLYEMLSNTITMVLSIGIIYYTCNPYLSMGVLLFESIIRNTLIYLYIKRKYTFINLKEAPNKLLKKDTKDMFIQKISSLAFSSTDILLISVFLGTKQTSIYSVYYMVMNGIQTFMTIITESPVPTFGNLFANDVNEQAKKAYHVYELFTIIIATILTSCFLILIIPFIIFYTKAINDINYINEGLAIFMILYFLIKCYRNNSAILLNAKGLFKQGKNIYLMEAIINLITSVILLLIFGIKGVVMGSAIAILYSTTMMVKLVYKQIINENLKKYLKKIIPNGVIVILSIIIMNLYLISINNIMQFILAGIIIFICIFIITVEVNYIFNKTLFLELITYIKSIFFKSKKVKE